MTYTSQGNEHGIYRSTDNGVSWNFVAEHAAGTTSPILIRGSMFLRDANTICGIFTTGDHNIFDTNFGSMNINTGAVTLSHFIYSKPTIGVNPPDPRPPSDQRTLVADDGLRAINYGWGSSSTTTTRYDGAVPGRQYNAIFNVSYTSDGGNTWTDITNNIQGICGNRWMKLMGCDGDSFYAWCFGGTNGPVNNGVKVKFT